MLGLILSRGCSFFFLIHVKLGALIINGLIQLYLPFNDLIVKVLQLGKKEV